MNGRRNRSPKTSGRLAEPRKRPERAPGVQSVFLICLALTAAVAAAHGRGLANGFTNYDDDIYVTNNAHVKRGLTLESIYWAFTVHDANWHPLTWLSLELDAEWNGANPFVFHLTNLLFHAANTLLLFLVLNWMTGARWRSALVAGLFGLHPLHVESVAWVTERKDVLSTFFGLLALGAYVSYARKCPWRFGSFSEVSPVLRRYLLVMSFFVLSLMAKPMLVTFPFLLLLLDYWPLKRFDREPAARLIAEKLPLIVLVVLSSIITYIAQSLEGTTRLFTDLGLEERVANALVSYVAYIGKTIWPFWLSVFYPHPHGSLRWWQAAFAVFVLGTISVLAWRQARARPYVLVGWLWFLGTLVPVIGIVQVGLQGMADRYTYWPLIGLFIAASWGLNDLARGQHRLEAVAAAACVAWLAVLAAATWQQTGFWKDSDTLWRHALQMNPNNEVAHLNLGILGQDKEPGEALSHYLQAASIRPSYAEAHMNAGVLLVRRGHLPGAIYHFSKSVELLPGKADMRTNLAQALLRAGKVDEAISQLRVALELDPHFANACLAMGRALARKGDLVGGESYLARGVDLAPDDPLAHNLLGNNLQEQGKLAEAIASYREAIRLNPESAEVRNNLGATLAQIGELSEARMQLALAVKLEPRMVPAHYNLAYVLNQQHDKAGADAEYRQGRQLDPTWPAGARQEAWRLATSPERGIRNPRRALHLAKQAADAAGGQEPEYLDTLAAAYAAAGDFEQATAISRTALERATSLKRDDLARQIDERGRCYAAHKTWSEPRPTHAP